MQDPEGEAKQLPVLSAVSQGGKQVVYPGGCNLHGKQSYARLPRE